VHAELAEPAGTPGPGNNIRVPVQHLQTEHPAHGGYVESLEYRDGLVWAGDTAYTGAKRLQFAPLHPSEETAWMPIWAAGHNASVSTCAICGDKLGPKQQRNKSKTCGRSCGATLRHQKRKELNNG